MLCVFEYHIYRLFLQDDFAQSGEVAMMQLSV